MTEQKKKKMKKDEESLRTRTNRARMKVLKVYTYWTWISQVGGQRSREMFLNPTIKVLQRTKLAAAAARLTIQSPSSGRSTSKAHTERKREEGISDDFLHLVQTLDSIRGILVDIWTWLGFKR